MVAKNTHDYNEVRKVLEGALRNGTPAQWSALAKAANIPVSTLRSAALREWNITSPSELLGRALGGSPPSRLGSSKKETANTLEIDYVSEAITTLDGALKASKIDLNVWEVKDYIINFWPVGMKIKDADGEESPLMIQLCQVKVWLVRKKLKPIMPMISPVEMKVKHIPRSKPKRGGVRRALILADPQIGFRRRLHTGDLIPFHDRRVLDLALQVSQSEDFDSLEVIGDCLDLSEWSTHFSAEPEFYWTTQPALIEWAYILGQFQHIPKKRVFEGNHEKRMADMVLTYAKAAYGLRPVDQLDLPPSLSIPRLMAYHSLGVDYISGYPDNCYWLNNNLMLTHGNIVRSGPGDTAKAVILKTTFTSVFGHIHRRELVSRRIKSRNGDVIQTAFCPGCACHIDGRVPGSRSDDQWQQGFGVIEYTEDMETIIPVPVDNGKAIYKGQLFTARDRDDEINAMLLEKLKY